MQDTNIGIKHNLLTAIEFIERDSKSKPWYSYKCDCGNIHRAVSYYVNNGSIKSCGCLKSKNHAGRTHGKAGTKVYKLWHSIMDRCYKETHKFYARYGGRGIEVCNEWLDFEGFYKYFGDIDKGLELDRIDNNKGYSPDNVRFTTRKINGQNTKLSKYWHVDGLKFLSVRDAAKHFLVAPSTIRTWCKGWRDYNTGTLHPAKNNCYCELKYKEQI